jgi:hypothetical protein
MTVPLEYRIERDALTIVVPGDNAEKVEETHAASAAS